MAESLAAVVPRKPAETIWRHFHVVQPMEPKRTSSDENGLGCLRV
jgi:hypothetical protein